MSLLDADAEIAVRERLPESAPACSRATTSTTSASSRASASAATPTRCSARSRRSRPNASAAIQALDRGDTAAYRDILGPTEALSQQVFAAPTYYYKTGVAFLSWLNGHQAAFQMVGGLHAARSLPHLSRIVELANASGSLERPELAAARWHSLLTLNGIDVAIPAPADDAAAATATTSAATDAATPATAPTPTIEVLA